MKMPQPGLDFLQKIIKECTILPLLKDAEKNSKIYIYGAGVLASSTAGFLKKHGICYAGMTVDKAYCTPQEGLVALEDLLAETTEKISLVVAFSGYAGKTPPKSDMLYKVLYCDMYLSGDDCTYDWVLENCENLRWMYQHLEDELSRRSFIAFLNQRISRQAGPLAEVCCPDQYFPEDLIRFGPNEVLVDCGAYTGDTAEQFVQALKSGGIETYNCILSFEPDPLNFKKLQQNRQKNHICIRKGTDSQERTINFSIDNKRSHIAEDGNFQIELTTIDHATENLPVSMIKMDIEGAELNSLKGAEKTIRRNHPKLAICIYHKADDLWEIARYIHSLSADYRFFVRAHEDISCEFVLYAL